MIKGARSSAVVALLVIVAGVGNRGLRELEFIEFLGQCELIRRKRPRPTGTSTTAGRGGGFFTSLTATQRSCLKSKGVTLPTGGGALWWRPLRRRLGHRDLHSRPTGTPPGGTFDDRRAVSGRAGPVRAGTGGGFRGSGRGPTPPSSPRRSRPAGVKTTGGFGGGLRSSGWHRRGSLSHQR